MNNKFYFVSVEKTVENKVSKLNLWEGDKIFLKWLYEKKFFSAKFVYQKGKLISHSVNFY